MMDNLDTLKKLISTRRTILILIAIGLDYQDPQDYNNLMITLYYMQFWKSSNSLIMLNFA